MAGTGLQARFNTLSQTEARQNTLPPLRKLPILTIEHCFYRPELHNRLTVQPR